jgi:DNA-binding transcriptional LysR family regulator
MGQINRRQRRQHARKEMNNLTRTTLEQWQILQAVVDHGGFAAAAEALHRSQSALSYTLARLQEQLPLPIIQQQGRRSVLTAAGEELLRHSRRLTEEATRLERLAATLAQGWEAEIRLAVEALFPSHLLFAAMHDFSERCGINDVRLQIIETVLSGTDEALFSHKVDLVITARVPPGFIGEPLLTIENIAVAHADHPLHRTEDQLELRDLTRARQIVIRDSGQTRQQDAGWLGAEQRWTVSHIKTAIDAVKQGLGFAWLPEAQISDDLKQGILRPLPLAAGGREQAQLYLIHADREAIGPGQRQLATLIHHHCQPASSLENAE